MQDHDQPRASALPIGIVGAGRVGHALAAALRRAGHRVDGPAGRGEVPAGEVVLLCVPDSEIEAAAEAVGAAALATADAEAGEALPGTAAAGAEAGQAGRGAARRPRFIGHTSGATPLTALAAAGGEPFGLHPLQTIAGADAELAGCGCAIGGSTEAALALARRLATDLGMHPVEVADEDRPAYHAAASIASNFLVALEAAAEAVAGGAGIAPADARRLLGPLVRTTVENWISLGPEAALTGPVARGDERTVASQREAVADAAPELLALFDELVERTRALARVPA